MPQTPDSFHEWYHATVKKIRMAGIKIPADPDIDWLRKMSDAADKIIKRRQQRGPIMAVKVNRPTREEMRGLLKELRDAAMNTPALDSSQDWTDLIVEVDAMLLRCKNGGRFKLTDVDHERIRSLAPEIYRRVEAKEPVLKIAHELKINRTTVRKWYKKEKRRLALEAGQS